MPFTLMNLPYDRDALEPLMSRETLDLHHGKHHRKYVDTLNELIADTPLEELTLEEVIFESAFAPSGEKIFNNAAQVWNHDLFWKSMTPGGGGRPDDRDLAAKIDAAFGSFDTFKAAFIDAAAGQFGSGWAWLVREDGRLKITATANAEPPMVDGGHAILACDVWEHAYYVDYRNDRGAFVEAFLDRLVNWDFVAAELRHGANIGRIADSHDRDAVKRFLATGEKQEKAA